MSCLRAKRYDYAMIWKRRRQLLARIQLISSFLWEFGIQGRTKCVNLTESLSKTRGVCNKKNWCIGVNLSLSKCWFWWQYNSCATLNTVLEVFRTFYIYIYICRHCTMGLKRLTKEADFILLFQGICFFSKLAFKFILFYHHKGGRIFWKCWNMPKKYV